MYGNVNTILDETPYQTQPAPAGSERLIGLIVVYITW